ncbi:UDP-N-acetylbacillosamine N-acetyltransferase, partial [Escherichia sp. TWPC-MK]
NTASVVEHDNCIGDFVHIGPNATLTGTVTIDDGTQIGAGATIIPNLIIGNWSMIGAGATVIHNIPSRCTAVGLPAKIIK